MATATISKAPALTIPQSIAIGSLAAKVLDRILLDSQHSSSGKLELFIAYVVYKTQHYRSSIMCDTLALIERMSLKPKYVMSNLRLKKQQIIFLSAYMIAGKVEYDEGFASKQLMVLSNLDVYFTFSRTELNDVEREMLDVLDWKVLPIKKDSVEIARELMSRSNTCGCQG